MSVIKTTFQQTGAVIPGWNVFSSGFGAAGVLSADLLDDVGASTGVSISTLKAFSGVLTQATIAVATAFGWEETVWDEFWYVTAANDGVMLRLAGLQEGDDYTIKLAGANNNVLPTIYDATGSISGPVMYTPSGVAGAPETQVIVTGVVPVGGIVDISMIEGSANFAYLTGFEMEYTTPVIGITQVGTINFTVSVNGIQSVTSLIRKGASAALKYLLFLMK